MAMTPWQLIFAQSIANSGRYAGEHLPVYHWNWPQGTWFQKRRSFLRRRRHPTVHDEHRA